MLSVQTPKAASPAPVTRDTLEMVSDVLIIIQDYYTIFTFSYIFCCQVASPAPLTKWCCMHELLVYNCHLNSLTVYQVSVIYATQMLPVPSPLVVSSASVTRDTVEMVWLVRAIHPIRKVNLWKPKCDGLATVHYLSS